MNSLSTNEMATGNTPTSALPGDPFIEQFFSRLPDTMHTDFTNRQLAALKSVFGDATRSGHGFDIRLSLPTPGFGRGLYMVFLGGRDRRDTLPGGQGGRPSRSGWRSLAAVSKLIIGGLFITQLLVAVITLAIWIL